MHWQKARSCNGEDLSSKKFFSDGDDHPASEAAMFKSSDNPRMTLPARQPLPDAYKKKKSSTFISKVLRKLSDNIFPLSSLIFLRIILLTQVLELSPASYYRLLLSYFFFFCSKANLNTNCRPSKQSNRSQPRHPRKTVF